MDTPVIRAITAVVAAGCTMAGASPAEAGVLAGQGVRGSVTRAVTSDPAYQTLLCPNPGRCIVRRPSMFDWPVEPLTQLPHFDPDAEDPWQLDLRHRDLSSLDLRDRLGDLLHASFDSRTQWPQTLPPQFDPATIADTAGNPGLHVRDLHRQGITGAGVGIAVIDQPLLTDHTEYASQLRGYEEIHVPQDSPAAMHGPAVASLAVGRTTGVAPGADLYYIAETHGVYQEDGTFDWDFTWLAQSIDRVLEINRTLPPASRIRVVSCSIGWSPDQQGYPEVAAAVRRARDAGVFVLSTSVEQTHQLAFHGLGRDPLADPDEVSSYGPGSWWAKRFLSGEDRFAPGTRLLAPMDARATAGPTGQNERAYYASGGWSWTVPYLAGLYALACQVNPDITPEQFWEAGLRTGATTTINHGNEQIPLGTIIQPTALIDTVATLRS